MLDITSLENKLQVDMLRSHAISIPTIISIVMNTVVETVKATFCNGVTQMVVITRYIDVVHTERDQCH